MVFIVTLLMSLSIRGVCANNEAKTEVTLHKKLFEDYLPEIRPVNNISEAVEVDINLFLSYDVASGSEITPCNKICKPLVVYRFSGNVMTSITTLRT